MTESTAPGGEDLSDILPRTFQVIEEGITGGLHTGVQLYVSRDRRTVADLGIGEARPGVPMTADTMTLWLSSGKPLTAVAVAQSSERGQIDFESPVAEYLPEFGCKGKELITIRHLLTHTAGLQPLDTGWPQAEWNDIVAAVCSTEIARGWIPGEKAGYDTSGSWFVLGEILQRIEGRSFSRVLRENLFEPLGMLDTWNGMPPDVYRACGEHLAFMYGREKNEWRLRDDHTEPWCTAASPGRNSRGPVRELGRFYEMLLAGGRRGDTRILSPDTVELLTTRHRAGMYDQTFRHVIDFGLGFIIDSNRYGEQTVPYGFGRYCSPRTFGHGGARSSIGFADPEQGLVVVWAANGMLAEPQHQRRNRTINDAIYADLGLR